MSGLGAAVTGIVIVADCVCTGDSLSLTETLNVAEELDVGVPEMTPDVEIDKPAGNWPEASDQLYGAVPPVACTVCV